MTSGGCGGPEMGIQGFSRYKGSQIGANGLGWL